MTSIFCCLSRHQDQEIGEEYKEENKLLETSLPLQAKLKCELESDSG